MIPHIASTVRFFIESRTMRMRWMGLLAAGVQIVAGLGSPVHAGADFYLRGELGANFSEDLKLSTRDNDRAAYCDGFVNPQYPEIRECTTPNRAIGAVDAWTSNFDDAFGIFAGVAVGRQFGQRLRVELEYFYREANVDQTAPIISPSGRPYTELFGPELPQAEERLRDLIAHNLFANAYLDFPNASRLTPYVGLGVGVGWTALDHSALWRRSNDPATIERTTEKAKNLGLSNEAAERLRHNLAGTESITRDKLKDTLFGYQVLAGLDYALTRSLSLGVLARWVDFGRFADGGSYRQLRDHVSNLRRDLSEPVMYRVQTPDITFFAVSLSLTFRFGAGESSL